jgi:hypothetical protein
MLTKRHCAWPRHSALALLLLAGSVGGCSFGGEPEPVFCYRTLADVSCYGEPDQGRAGQLVGVYLRDADDPTNKDYWLRRAEARMSR